MQRFTGTWKLVSWESRDAQGSISYPFGREIIGYIMYGADGYMSVVIAKKNRIPFVSKDFFGGSQAEKANAYETYLSYCGLYRVQDNIVTHNCEINLYPNWSGVSQERFYKFYTNRLELSTAPFFTDGKEQTHHLIWEKAKIMG
ncbi:MAG: lipocalin-like domain-containing protein [Gammaproteobacteria bacterium]|nr:lipocalin-like domain-containing protein [Gammaproteobacteria bacterium]